jgi:outer membrane lipoprotein-sorting protein
MKKILFTTIFATLVVSTVFAQRQRRQRPEQNKTFTERGVDDPAAHAVLGEVIKNLKSFRSLKFDFTLITENRNDRNGSNTQKGTILIKGDKYNLNFMEMNAISDGKTVWNFNTETKEVHINNADPRNMEMLNPLTLIETYDKNFRAKLIREDKERGVDVIIIDLIPFENRSFHKVRMLTDKAKKTIVSIEIHEKNNTTMTFRVDRMQTNVSAPDSEFRFDVSKHPGVEVVDLR